ncbi:MAG: hypothetical protein IKR68_06730 [Lachnospiraceae bacterium]|nr:hypothetical protein [Lachnospiraceae bacterium]
MYRIIIVTDTSRRPQHAEISRWIKGALDEAETTIFDMNCCMAEHEKFYTIKDSEADILITLDCAGFEMVNIMDVLSYNTLKMPMAHILFERSSAHEEALSHLQNLSMFTYIPGSEDMEEFKAAFPLVPNVKRHELGDGMKGSADYKSWFEDYVNEYPDL